MKTMSRLLVLVTVLIVAGTGSEAQASQKWTVKGNIKAVHTLSEMSTAFGEKYPLEGITVKLSARSKIAVVGWGTWNSWGTKTTGKDGEFSFTEQHNGDRRQFKLEILFDSDDLRIKEGQETSVQLDNNGFPLDVHLDLSDKDWHEVMNDKDNGPDDGRKAGVINLGDVMITRTLVREHADIWFLYHKVFDLLKGYGKDYEFKSKVVIKYPMSIAGNNSSSSSYTNPLNNHVYIKQGQFNSNTLMHELMHKWLYEHSTGEDNMAWQLIKHGDTHQDRENTTYVPFQEGFAEWSTYKLLQEITSGKVGNFDRGSSFDKPDLPLNRNYIGEHFAASERLLANMDYSERGWHSLLNILTYKALGSVDFNLPVNDMYAKRSDKIRCPEAKLGYSFKDVLSIFMKSQSQGVDKYMSTKDMNFSGYLDRASSMLAGLGTEKIKQIKSYLDPNETLNPNDYYCGKPAVTGSKANPNIIKNHLTNTPRP